MQTKSVGVDIKLLGGLLLILGAADLVITVLFPPHVLKLFGTTVTGPFSFLVTLLSPAVMLSIGYGLLSLRPWAWGLGMAYAGFGIVSEAMNQFAFGFHLARSGFIITVILFAFHLIWRRGVFIDKHVSGHKPKPASQEIL